MKIIYAAFKYDYADKKRGLAYEHFNFWDALSRMYGDGVIYFPVDERIMKLGRSGMNKELLALVRREKPDILFCNLFNNEIKPSTINEITQNTTTITVNWFSDDQWRFESFSKYWAPLFDWVITTDPNAVTKYKKMGYQNVIRSQYAANTKIYRPVDGKSKYDVTFVGRRYGSRGDFVEFLESNGLRVSCWGKGWPQGRASQDKMIEVFSQSKINLNFTDVSASNRDLKNMIKAVAKLFLHRGVNNKYHFFSPPMIIRNISNFSAPTLRPQIKGRNFEIPACGGFLLTQEAEDLFNFYKYGEEIDVFVTKEDLLDKIRYYLTHEQKRDQIAKSGYERTIREHTWEHRFAKIVEVVMGSGKRKQG